MADIKNITKDQLADWLVSMARRRFQHERSLADSLQQAADFALGSALGDCLQKAADCAGKRVDDDKEMLEILENFSTKAKLSKIK